MFGCGQFESQLSVGTVAASQFFRIRGGEEGGERFTHDRSPSFSTVPGRQVEMECSLVFLPEKSWFGPAGPRSVY